MQKSTIMLISSATLIVIGLILSAVGEQIILGGFSQGTGKVSSSQTLSISVEFDSQETSVGIFAVQIMEFKDNTFYAKVLDPFNNEIISQSIIKETIENEFDIFETGTYKLIIESNSNEDPIVFATIGPFPDASKLSLRPISMIILVIGMAGLVIVGIYGIKNRRRSI
jgi:hypothetical protein